jgi:Ohr subfamily peroxiredoxin
MSFTTSATTVAGRNGHVTSADGIIHFDLAMPKPDGTPSRPNATNPEALFAAGYSACYGQALIALSAAHKVKPEQITVTAEVTLHTENNDYKLSVVLKPTIVGLERSVAQELADKAHEQVCPYSKATRNNIPVTVELQ